MNSEQLGDIFDALVSQSADELAELADWHDSRLNEAAEALAPKSNDGLDKLLGTLWDATVKIDKLVVPSPPKESKTSINATKLERAQYLAVYLVQQLDKALEIQNKIKAYQHKRRTCRGFDT